MLAYADDQGCKKGNMWTTGDQKILSAHKVYVFVITAKKPFEFANILDLFDQ